MQALTGRALTIYGDGTQTRSFCYVSDLIRGLVRLMNVEPNPNAPVNLGNPEEFTINELAGLVSRMTGTDCRRRHFPIPPDDPRRRRPDITRARTLLKWSPQIPIEEGLGPTIAYFRSLAGGTAPRKSYGKSGKARAAAMNGVAP